MKKQLFGLSGTMMVAFLVAGCASDPLDDSRNVVSSVSTSLSYVEVLVGDSTEATAQSRDALGNALAALPDVSSANTAVATISDNPRSGEPEPTKIFSIVATGFGITIVTASSGSNTADITVQTWPASVDVAGIAAGTQVTSGFVLQLTATALGTDGSAVAGGPSITWASVDANTASVDATGLVTALTPGLGTITATTDGGAVGQASFEVIPLPFPGTISQITGVLGNIITLTQAAGGAAFDSDTQVDFDGTGATILSVSATQLVFTVPVGSSGSDVFTVTVSNIDSGQLTQTFDFTVVVPPAFAGTLSSGSGTIDQHITLTIAAGDPAVDADTEVQIDGVAGATVSNTATDIVFAVPSSLAAGTFEAVVIGLGSLNDALLFSFDVTEDAFTGTVSAATADPFDQITITPGGIAWDGGEIITVDGKTPWIVSQDATSAVILVPSPDATGATEVLIRKQGVDDIAGFDSIDMQSVFTPNGDISPVVDLLGGPFPTTAFTQLSDDQPDDFFGLDNSGGGAAVAISFTLAWQGPATDLDAANVDCAFTAFVGTRGAETGANPEATSESVPAGECWLLWFLKFDTGTGATIAQWSIDSP